MSELKLLSPLLDNYVVGDPISEKPGVRCCPALERDLQTKCIVKIISTPASQGQLDALLLTGAYADAQSALQYFQSVANGISEEADILKRLSQLEGFFPYLNWQIAPMSDGVGFDVYTISQYRKTLAKLLNGNNLTHLAAVNLGLDLCTALAVCRRIGYLYINLKPENIYLADNNTWKIGDIGFVSLDSLKYASLPERYRSDYTAPEINDAFASLNTTLDVYALGLVLYKIYNGNQLPANLGNTENEALVPPDYADYELSEIILKACDPLPENRWQDPIEMGQALVTYMQRNAVNDTPIVPPPVTVPSTEDLPQEITDTSVAEATPPEIDETASLSGTDKQDDLTSSETVADEDLSAILTPSEDETAPELNEDLLGDIAVTNEVSDILLLADDLAAHPVPEMPTAEATESTNDAITQSSPQDNNVTTEANDSLDNVAPIADAPVVTDAEQIAEPAEEPVITEDALSTVEPVADTVDEIAAEQAPESISPEKTEDSVTSPPEPISVSEAENDSTESNDPNTEQRDEQNTVQGETAAEDNKTEETEQTEEAELADEPIEDSSDEDSHKKSHWLRNLLIAAIIALLAAAGYLFYTKYYHQTIDQLEITTANDGDVTIRVTTRADESKLTVICEDAYHNPKSTSVKNGIAVFEDLAPGAAYTIKVEMSGIHKLTGKTSSAFTTPDQIEFVSFEALTGDEDGSVLLQIKTRKQASENWCVTYTSDDGTEETVIFSDDEYTIRNLVIGNEYTFHLAPEAEIRYSGVTEVKHTVGNVILPEAVHVTGVTAGNLTVAWSTPSGLENIKWIVHCYNDNGFHNTVETEDNTATFEGIDTAFSYTVEVSADGMSQAGSATIPANVVTITDFAAIEQGRNLVMNWTQDGEETTSGWLITYSVDNSPVQELPCEETPDAVIPNFIPGSVYSIQLKTADGSDVLGGNLTFKTSKAKKFSGYTVTASDMRFKLCRTPKKSNWSEKDLKASDYTSTFKVGEKASFLIALTKSYNSLSEKVSTLMVFRDTENSVVLTAVSERTWRQMWYEGKCELDIPELPSTPGQYTISVYMNGMLAGESRITITQ